LAYFGIGAPNYEVFCVFRQISSLKALSRDAVDRLSIALYNLE
jgi:hypothetical protein